MKTPPQLSSSFVSTLLLSSRRRRITNLASSASGHHQLSFILATTEPNTMTNFEEGSRINTSTGSGNNEIGDVEPSSVSDCSLPLSRLIPNLILSTPPFVSRPTSWCHRFSAFDLLFGNFTSRSGSASQWLPALTEAALVATCTVMPLLIDQERV
ncbi:hypothetical protein Q3G72_016072 [Acer saccharum]|nr:hypothetical protein Q3G72_016072 [Acer saccharum]